NITTSYIKIPSKRTTTKLYPYTTLFRSYEGKQVLEENLEYMDENKTGVLLKLSVRMGAILAEFSENDVERLTAYAKKIGLAFQIDRKSTRLNSSHVSTSYAVICLKKKTA